MIPTLLCVACLTKPALNLDNIRDDLEAGETAIIDAVCQRVFAHTVESIGAAKIWRLEIWRSEGCTGGGSQLALDSLCDEKELWRARVREQYQNRVLAIVSGCNEVHLTPEDELIVNLVLKRLWKGREVAEAKFRSNPALYSSLIAARDLPGLHAALTNSAVETQVLQRVHKKTEAKVRELHRLNKGRKQLAEVALLLPTLMVEYYADFIIPETKEVEVAYFLARRCRHPTVTSPNPIDQQSGLLSRMLTSKVAALQLFVSEFILRLCDLPNALSRASL